MTNWFQRTLAALTPARETKHTPPHNMIALHATGQPVWTPRNYEALAREGFSGNAIGYRCVSMIARAAASVPFQVRQGGTMKPDHPVAQLLAAPNGDDGGVALMERFYSFLMISGNAYIRAISINDRVRQLHVLRPDRMRVVAGANGWPVAYDYRLNADTIRFDQNSGPLPPILHARLFNPVDDHYGLSPFEAAAKAIDIHNAAGAWNKALLDNAARPSGALVYGTGGTDNNLTAEQFERLKAELQNTYQGAANAGRPMVLEGGLDWKPLSLSPKEMEHIEAKHIAAREIALAFGVPPMLLAIPGDNTYANYAEANRAFWRQTILPLVAQTGQDLTNWLSPAFGDDITIGFDPDKITALAGERRALWSMLTSADFLTTEEKRRIAGLD